MDKIMPQIVQHIRSGIANTIQCLPRNTDEKYSMRKTNRDTRNITTIMSVEWGNMKFAYRNREFWCKGYYVDTAGKNTKVIKEYIANQLKQDKETDQLTLFDPRDPFMGSK